MSVVTIWEPRRYVPTFQSMFNNGPVVEGLKSHDTKVCEIARFVGETVQRYNRAGEMALTLYGIRPEDVSHRYLLELEGRHYLIERFEWEAEGGMCNVEGRSVEAYLDMEYDCYDRPGNVYINGTPAEQVYSTAFNRYNFLRFLQIYMGATSNRPVNFVADGYPFAAGWWRDLERFDGGSINGCATLETYAGSTTPMTAAKGTGIVREVQTWGAHLRTLCALFGFGYRWDLTWSGSLGLYKVKFAVYERPDSGVVMRSTDAGVSEFVYSQDSRDVCNTVLYCYTDHVDDFGKYDADGPVHVHYGMKSRNGFFPVGDTPGEVANACEMAEHMHSDFVDLGAVPEADGAVQIDGVPLQTQAWVSAQLVDKTSGMFGGTVEECSFEYDGKGRYRYGRHFHLGSRVGIVDEATGYAATQVLTEVTTRYNGGSQSPSYGFKFGDRRRTAADKILGRFGEIDRRTSSY